MLFNLGQTLRSLTTSPLSTAVDQAHRMARGRLQAGGPAVSARGGVDHNSGRRLVRVPVAAAPPQGSHTVTLDLPEAFVDRLLDLGHLRPGDRQDRNQVLLALYRFLDHSALGDAHR
jgi:hypothetical protein